MLKLLYVGDCHATPDSLVEMQALIELIKQTADKYGVNGIVFLGDQFHTHATINVYVMKFWQNAIKYLFPYDLVFLVGNHDIPGKADAVEANAMAVYAAGSYVTIVDKPKKIWSLVFSPYFHDKTEFETFDWPEAKTLVCHQSFLGAQYENGFYDKDGAEQSKLPFERIVSGHIHKQSKFGKVHYVGSPRWRTVDDANEQKFIWVMTYDNQGDMVEEIHVRTDPACEPMFIKTWKEGETLPDISPHGKTTIDLIGSEVWIREKEEDLKIWKNLRVRRFFVTQSAPKVRESDGLGQSFKKYVDLYPFPNKSNPDKVWGEISPQVTWLRNG